MQNVKTGFLLLGLILALVACNEVNQEEITPTTMVPTSTPVPATATLVPTATITPIPTLRADGPLSDEGPYLVYKDIEDGVLSIVLVSGDGSGRKVIAFPENSTIDNLRTALSPDGQWLAFHSGTLSDTFEDAANNNLTLNLMHLPDGEITQVANLLSNDFLDKFPLFVDAVYALEEYPESLTNDAGYREWIWDVFRFGLFKLAWSPHGNYLAYIGQIEGVSPDIHLYDMQTQTSSRLSNGLDVVQYMKWSPNETNLFFGVSHESAVNDTNTYYLANIEKASIELEGYSGCGGATAFREWLSEDQILTHCRVNILGHGFLYARDLIGENKQRIYPDQFNDYIYDAEQNYLLLSASMTVGDDYLDYVSGIRFYYPETGEEVFLREGYYPVLLQVDLDEYKYIAWGNRERNIEKLETIGITEEGEIVPIRDYEAMVFLSPDKRWMVLKGYKEDLEIISTQTDQSYVLSDIDVARVFWRPDSQVLFFSTSDLIQTGSSAWETELFYYDFMNNVVALIDSFIKDHPLFSFVWIP
ncbi:MAG: hypothetical protein DWQ07_21325 [Chloroflexi bacterium]|nr:MAG: hypothetical protein DWQ07_21325 [Chloroflexota bacterium]MBL1196637.1 hypothetical protein [Chloroflexota bacterium]NOH13930.1 hypothetical protein [Chloroflexota bacterium]